VLHAIPCVATADGTPIRAQKGMDDDLTLKYAQNISHLAERARDAIRKIDSAVRTPPPPLRCAALGCAALLSGQSRLTPPSAPTVVALLCYRTI
jgi:hypothetical protein